MRTTTLTRGFRVALILAGLLVLPQFASAQLSAIETRVLKLQGATSGAVSLDAVAAVTASYALRFPAAQASAAGAFLYVANTTTGELAFTNTTGLVQGSTPVWDTTSKTIKWEDPSGAANPNWSRTGNAITGTGTLGASSNQGFNIITNNKTRVGFAADGAITVNTTADGGATTTIGRAAGHTTAINGATNITGVTTQTGNFNFAGDSSALQVKGSAGTSGDVLVSAGTGLTPTWKSLSDATGIKASGTATFATENTKTVTLASIQADDKILITVESATGVLAQVTTVTGGVSFVIGTSASFSGDVHYLVMD